MFVFPWEYISDDLDLRSLSLPACMKFLLAFAEVRCIVFRGLAFVLSPRFHRPL